MCTQECGEQSASVCFGQFGVGAYFWDTFLHGDELVGRLYRCCSRDVNSRAQPQAVWLKAVGLGLQDAIVSIVSKLGGRRRRFGRTGPRKGRGQDGSLNYTG